MVEEKYMVAVFIALNAWEIEHEFENDGAYEAIVSRAIREMNANMPEIREKHGWDWSEKAEWFYMPHPSVDDEKYTVTAVI
jgi:hypothetical protein